MKSPETYQAIPTPENERERRVKEYITLGERLANRAEGFPFPGLTDESYRSLKEVAEEFPEYSTPIDELLKKLQDGGMKIDLVIGQKGLADIHILPRENADPLMDNLFPRHLQITDDMDEDLKKLIEMNRAIKDAA